VRVTPLRTASPLSDEPRPTWRRMTYPSKQGRLRRWRWPLAAALLLVVGLCLVSSPAADGSVEGLAPAPVHELHVDAVGLSGRTAWVVHVERGDTLSEIAQRHLGTAKRTAEVVRLNPRVNAKALRVGQPIVLPPKNTAGWLELYAATPGGLAQPVGVGEPAVLSLAPVTLFAVPHERVAALRALDRDRQLVESLLRADARVLRSAPLEAQAAAGRDLARAITRVRVVGLKGSTSEGMALELAVLDQHLLSASGHRLVPAAEEGQETGGLAVPLLLVLAGLVVFALVAVAARRMEAAGRADGEPRGLA
jgi:LysM repeat protein